VLYLPLFPGIIVCHLHLTHFHKALTINLDYQSALHNAWSPILAAIFAGNGIVLKCSENVIWSTTWFVGAITRCLEICGHDPDLVQVVSCYPEQADALTKSPKIKHITFIGSETVGRKVGYFICV
jgi:acyl-CoA reductase-like NAD-dependent aldehyde dehydrogenase